MNIRRIFEVRRFCFVRTMQHKIHVIFSRRFSIFLHCYFFFQLFHPSTRDATIFSTWTVITDPKPCAKPPNHQPSYAASRQTLNAYIFSHTEPLLLFYVHLFDLHIKWALPDIAIVALFCRISNHPRTLRLDIVRQQNCDTSKLLLPHISVW